MIPDPPRILVIDDNPEIHRDVAKVLGPPPDRSGLDAAEAVLFGTSMPVSAIPGGFAIDAALQGAEGIALVERSLADGRPFAAAFVDMRMPPGLDGLETISRLMPLDPRLQLVICTAYSDYSWQQLADRLGATDRLLILKKPFDPIEILQLAHTLTAKWRLAWQAEGERDRLEAAVTARTAELAEANAALHRTVLELRTSAEQLARSEARFRAVIESAAVAIAIIDGRGVVWQWNPGAERLFAWPSGDALGRRLGDAVPELAGDGLAAALARAELSSGGPLPLTGRARDGRRLDLEAYLSCWAADDGVLACIIMQDIGARLRAEAAIVQARDAAELAARAKSDFLAMVSHELRTPMNGIIGMTELLLDSPLAEEQREFAATVRDSSATLLRLVNEVLDFSRIEAGRMELEAVEFDPRSAAEDILDLLAPQARGKGLALVLAVDAAVPSLVRGDPTRFKQVLTNLAGNAVKFTPAGRVEVALAVHPDVPEVLRLEVTDTGIGIAQGDQGRLFEPFTQVDTASTRRFGGTGLGLAISRRLVELMGGRLGLTSVAGEGSCFWCELPLPGLSAPAAADPTGDLAGFRALCVDASPAGAQAVAALLAGWGVACTVAASAAQAFAVAADHDLALVETRLGEDDGLDPVRRLRDAGGPPVLVLARDPQPGLGEAVRAAGAVGLLTHPLDRDQLHEALRAIRAGDTGTGLLTRHSLAERRRRRRPGVLLAGGEGPERVRRLAALAGMACRVDVARLDDALAACVRRSYALVILGPEAADDAEGRIAALRAAGCDARIAVIDAGDRAGALPGDPDGFAAGVRRLLPSRSGDQIQGTSASPPTSSTDGLPTAVSAAMLAIARADLTAVRTAAATLASLSVQAGALPMAALADDLARHAAADDLPACSRLAGRLHEGLRHLLARR